MNPIPSFKLAALLLGILCAGCIMDPEPKERVISCGSIDFEDGVPDTFAVAGTECRRVPD